MGFGSAGSGRRKPVTTTSTAVMDVSLLSAASGEVRSNAMTAGANCRHQFTRQAVVRP
jgi:hypothetical protein